MATCYNGQPNAHDQLCPRILQYNVLNCCDSLAVRKTVQPADITFDDGSEDNLHFDDVF